MNLPKVFPITLFAVALAVLLALPIPAVAKPKKTSFRNSQTQPCTTRTGLHCEIYGSGDPILCLHGLGGSIYSWREFKGRFPNNQLILIDLRGAGQSPKPRDKGYSILTQADLIFDFIQEHELKNLTIVGNSYGGAVSLLVSIALTEKDPTRFSKLVLIDSGGYDKGLPGYLYLLRSVFGLPILEILGSKRVVTKVLNQSYAVPSRITKAQIAAYAAPLNDKNGKYALAQMAKQAIPADFKQIIAKYPCIKVPTLILWGDDDRVIPLSIGAMLRDAIPNSELRIISSAGHIPQEEQPIATVCEIRKFLEPGYSCRPSPALTCPIK